MREINKIVNTLKKFLDEAKEYSPETSILWGPAARAWCYDLRVKMVESLALSGYHVWVEEKAEFRDLCGKSYYVCFEVDETKTEGPTTHEQTSLKE